VVTRLPGNRDNRVIYRVENPYCHVLPWLLCICGNRQSGNVLLSFQPVTQNVILSGSYWIIDHIINPSELDYYARLDKVFLASCMKELHHVSHGIHFHEETAPTHFPDFVHCVCTRDFYAVLNSLKAIVVGEEAHRLIFHHHVISKTNQWM
jgi:hypothetical protein